MTKTDPNRFYVELRRKIAKRYKGRKKADLSDTLEIKVAKECVKEFLDNPPEYLGLNRQELLKLLQLTAESRMFSHANGRTFTAGSASILCMISAFSLISVTNEGLISDVLPYIMVASCFIMTALSLLLLISNLLRTAQNRWDACIKVVADHFDGLPETEGE
jgi:hypothetical protein